MTEIISEKIATIITISSMQEDDLSAKLIEGALTASKSSTAIVLSPMSTAINQIANIT